MHTLTLNQASSTQTRHGLAIVVATSLLIASAISIGQPGLASGLGNKFRPLSDRELNELGAIRSDSTSEAQLWRPKTQKRKARINFETTIQQSQLRVEQERYERERDRMILEMQSSTIR